EDLKALSDRQKFRADLYYRIGVAFIELPPLRERREDIPLLFEHFTLQAAKKYDRPAPVPSHAQLADLMAYAWPGNVRELRNVLERACVVSGDASELRAEHMLLNAGARPAATASSTATATAVRHDLHAAVNETEQKALLNALQETKGNKLLAARLLGISRSTLYNKLKQMALER
ncbi:MAG: helix-turn-helix domain-containing protein, partial [Hydrogenophaga sp.]|uniref:helix-turn-helix domain-containing protein n=1 Tax=Hydrogenophaga sp. TaxID=1904254 RepID=UPI00403548F1